jgi:hypothetical protein
MAVTLLNSISKSDSTVQAAQKSSQVFRLFSGAPFKSKSLAP